MRRFHTLAVFSTALTLALSASADVITDWNGTAVEVARSFANPNPASYSIVLAHLAAYDAVNAIHRTGAPFLSDSATLHADASASLEAAAAQAFYDVLVSKVPGSQKGALDEALAASLARVPDGDAKTQGIAVGSAAAAALLTARSADVWSPSPAPDPYVGEDSLGKWRPTPRENTANAPLPGNTPWWANLKPFALDAGNAVDPGAPPPLSSSRYAIDYLEVKQYGVKTNSARSADQTNIARFWAQQTHVPFNAIARSLSLRQHLSVEDNARLFALLNLAIADSRIAIWSAKYAYSAWRPITAINYQGDDGNADTVAAAPPATGTDPTWLPLLETPNHPEYPSGHSGTGAAAAGVLATWFGDATAFTVGSDTQLGFTRSFTSLSQAAEENANSRIYGGIHFRYANEAGITLGHKIADRVTTQLLKADAVPTDNGAGGAGGAPEENGGEPSVGGTESGGTAGSSGSGGTESAGTAGSSAGTNASTAGTGGNAPSEGGDSSVEEGGAPSTASGGKAGSKSTRKDDDEGDSCSVSAPAGKTSPLWLLGLGAAALAWQRRRRAR
jgi:MYXO-CTERM domain-containing protein